MIPAAVPRRVAASVNEKEPGDMETGLSWQLLALAVQGGDRRQDDPPREGQALRKGVLVKCHRGM